MLFRSIHNCNFAAFPLPPINAALTYCAELPRKKIKYFESFITDATTKSKTPFGDNNDGNRNRNGNAGLPVRLILIHKNWSTRAWKEGREVRERRSGVKSRHCNFSELELE